MSEKSSTAEMAVSAVMIVSWICGIVAANGFWSTLLAVFFPPWAWYLFAERLMQAVGLA